MSAGGVPGHLAPVVIMWRCSKCGRWSHAKRRPRFHVRYLDEHVEIDRYLPVDVIENGLAGAEEGTGAPLYYVKVRCGPFEKWMATCVEDPLRFEIERNAPFEAIVSPLEVHR